MFCVNWQAPDHRRKWDVEEFEKLAAKRLEDDEEEDDEEKPKKRELLKQRDYRVDLDSRLGKSIVITKNTPASQAGGYYCNVCDCVVKDSINFLDHINGKKRKGQFLQILMYLCSVDMLMNRICFCYLDQRNLGMSMKIERSTLDQVKQRFEMNKQKRTEQQKKYDLEKRIQELQEEVGCILFFCGFYYLTIFFNP